MTQTVVAERGQVFTTQMEKDLASQITALADRFYGVSVKKCRQMAYQMACVNKVLVPKSWQKNEMAGYDWYAGFKERHKLSVRTAEATSMARATAFNKTTVKEFFDNLVMLWIGRRER